MKRLLVATAATLFAIAAQASAPPVTLVAPVAGARLAGGQESVLLWSASSLPEGVEEWEAFLSLDGGKSYPLRITPHLDARIRSFRWHVPNVAAANVRILIRIGDERDERLIALPQAFTIEPTYRALDLAALQIAPTDDRGEAALEDGKPVVQWVGSDLVTHRHRDVDLADAAQFVRGDFPEAAAAHGSSHISLRRPRCAANLSSRSDPLPAPDSRGALRPLLLLMTRLNI